MPWYVFNPGSFPASPCDPNNYILVGTAPNCPGVNNVLCAIQADDNMEHPILTAALCSEIATALQNKIDTTNVKLRP